MENGFSSPRGDAFPAGLRVLIVDDDPTWLKILEKMLMKCSYEVTTCGLAREALNLLRERKDGYDIVISDVNMPDMDGFKLLEHLGLEMDLPVIMMSVDGEISRVMKGVQHGACDYLLKPIRMKELRNIWQHVLRKKIHEVREIETHDCFEGMFGRTGSDQSDDGQFIRGEDENTLLKKRKDFDNHDEKDIGDASSMKRTRVVWSVHLHQKFVKAVDLIGLERVGPKKILDLMNVPWLTRENVASHLQKYRLYLARLQKQNDGQSYCMGMKPFDVPPNAQTPTSCLQNTPLMDRHEAQNLKCGLPGKGLEWNFPMIVSEPALELERSISSSPTESNKTWKKKLSASSKQTEIEAFEAQLKAESKTLVPSTSDFSSISLKPSTEEAEIINSFPMVASTTIGTKKPELVESGRFETGRGLDWNWLDDEMEFVWLQEDCIVENLAQNVDFPDCKDSGLIADYIWHDHWYGPTEYILK